MKVTPVVSYTPQNVTNYSQPKSSPSFKTGLSVNGNVYGTISNTSKFNSVMSEFRSWLRGQFPTSATLNIMKNNNPEFVEQLENGRVMKRAENLLLRLGKGSSGFCFNEYESDETILADLKYTFECVRANSGY